MSDWTLNEYGYWCPACGYLVAAADSETPPDDCRQCGFPDPEAVADYHGFGTDDEQDDGLDEDGNIPFECAAFWVDGGWYCPMQGSEECDWDCPHS